MHKPGTTDYKRERNAALYDRLNIVIPKGFKSAVEAHAKRKGQSVNGLINELLRMDMSFNECEWKPQTEEPTTADAPITEEPIKQEEPATEEPVKQEEPVTEEPEKQEEPKTKEPVTEEPAQEQINTQTAIDELLEFEEQRMHQYGIGDKHIPMPWDKPKAKKKKEPWQYEDNNDPMPWDE